MNQTDFKDKARALMVRHGIGHLPLEMDGGKNRLGACYTRKVNDQDMRPVVIPVKLSFSRHYVHLLDWPELEKTVLHEIAHALTPGHKHGPVWKAKAREFGLTGDRCAAPTARPAGSVTLTCRKCGTKAGDQHRLPLRVYICAQRACKSKNGTVPLTVIKDGREVSVYDMPTRYRQEWNSLVNRGKIQA